MKIGKKLAAMAVSVGMVVFGSSGIASAHVVVRPADAKTGTYQTFTVSVPVEKDNPTVGVKLAIPKGVMYVTPTIKPGWAIQTEKQGTGDDAVVTSINWTGGSIGVGLRDEFTFSAKTSDQPVDLQWKAYQTYQDGTVVSWDQQPAGEEKEGGTTGPFSVTKVAADSDQDKALKALESKVMDTQQRADTAFYVGLGGVVLALAALIACMMYRKRV